MDMDTLQFSIDICDTFWDILCCYLFFLSGFFFGLYVVNSCQGCILHGIGSDYSKDCVTLDIVTEKNEHVQDDHSIVQLYIQ